MTATHCALIYTVLACLPLAMHLALAAGAPLGRFTVGGRFDRQLPPLWRVLALVQGGLLAAMAAVMLDRAGVIGLSLPGWAAWAVLGLTGLTFLANAASPSRPERLLWAPVTGFMVLSGLGAAIL